MPGRLDVLGIRGVIKVGCRTAADGFRGLRAGERRVEGRG